MLFPMKLWKISRDFGYQQCQIWQGKKETCMRLSNSPYQEYWSSTWGPWGMENLYSECALVFVHSIVRSATKLLGLSLSDEKVCLHHMQSSLVKVWLKGILFCTVLWFQRGSTFKMQNIQWKLNETPNLLHSWPTSFFHLKLNVKVP